MLIIRKIGKTLRGQAKPYQIITAAILGTLIGVGYVKLISGFRKKMAKVEADSEKYADFTSKRIVRIIMWVLFGGKAKQSYAELMDQKKIGNPIRLLGVVFAVLVVALLFILQQFASGPMITTLLKGQFEEFHGATVDLKGIDLDLANGQLTIDYLAMADPDNLSTDLIRGQQVVAKVSTADLLRKRIVIDQILVNDPVQGAKRDKPGVLIGKRPSKPTPSDEGTKTLDDWFAKAKTWKERLDTVRHWLEKLRGLTDEQTADKDEEKGRLRQWAEQYGHAEVRAAHLIEGAPTVLVKDLQINKLRAQWPDTETLDIHATNLSTHPALVPDKPRITVRSSGNTFDLDLAIAPRAQADQQSELQLTLRNQSIDQTMGDLNVGNDTGFKGGTWLAGVQGNWSDLDGLNLPLTLVLENTTASIAGQQQPVERFPLSFAITGSIDTPNLTIDTKKLAQAVSDSFGKAMLKQFINDQVGNELGGTLLDAAGGILGGDKKSKEKETDRESEENDLGDKLREGLGGFLNRGTDDE